MLQNGLFKQYTLYADDANVKVHKTYNDNETTAHLLQLFKDEGAHDAIADNQWEEADVGEKERGKGACELATVGVVNKRFR